MCLAIPAIVVALPEDGIASVELYIDPETVRTVAIADDLMKEGLDVGDTVFVHAGFAIRRIEPAEANHHLAVLEAMADGEGWDLLAEVKKGEGW